jgi:hypothetical protein
LTLLLLTLLLPLNAGAERESRAGGDVFLEMPPLTLPLAFPIACADVEEEEDVEEDKLGCGGGGTTEESRAGGEVCLEMPPLTLTLPLAEDKLGCGGGGTTEALSRS